jgi:hypothetical protein
MKLIGFELKKMLSSKVFRLLIIAFLALDVFVFVYNFNTVKPNYKSADILTEAYNELYSDVSGQLTNEKVDFVVSEHERLQRIIEKMDFSRDYNPNLYTGYYMGDANLLKDGFYNPLKYAVTYKTLIGTVADKAEENIGIYQSFGNEYDAAVNQQIVDKYQGRQITHFYDYFGTAVLFQYIFSAILIILLDIIIVTPLFISERETEMDMILSTSVKGRKPTVAAKFITAIFWNFVMCVLFSGLDLLMFSVTYSNFEGWSQPLYAIELFKNTPLTISVAAYYLVSKAMLVLGTSTIIMLMIQLTKNFKRVLFPYIINLFIVAGLYGVYQLRTEPFFTTLNLFNPINLVLPIDLFKDYQAINTFGVPADYGLFAVCCAGLVFAAVALSLFMSKRYVQRRRVSHEKAVRV